ncbi:MAG: DNA helicase RecQ [Chloroflexi bacterium]|nr:DNA helicase RecQ [Chloroflexota bacterium]
MATKTSILDLLKTSFGFDSFRPLQEEIISHILSGRDALVLMPTGGGKSLCYQLPALCMDGITLVVSPLIALMKDQVDSLRANGIAAEFINSTLTQSEMARVQNQAAGGQVKILYLAPERLALSGFRGFLRSLNVSLIAIDEAHCISEWGHDFRPDYRNLKALRRDFPSAPVIALTATATERVREDIILQLGLQDGRAFISSFNRPNLTYTVQPKRRSFEALLGMLRRHKDRPAIIYCFSRKDTEGLAADLTANGIKAAAYHAGLDNDVRRQTQEDFIRDRVTVIVATIAFGMGIDKPDIRLVVHYDLPKSLEGYYQETGRAGRDGLPSDCALFYSYSDKFKQDFFIDQMEDDSERQNARQKLAQMLDYGELRVCRRKFLLEYFGERWDAENCGGCDVCLASGEEFDATVIAQKVLSAVVRTGERFGANHVIEVLRGARTKRVLGLGHDRLSVYGIVTDYGDEELREIINLLVTKGLLVKTGDKYPTLGVTQAGWRFLKQREKLMLPKLRQSEEAASSAESGGLDYDRRLFEELRALRKRLADAQGVPPFVVFGDVSLQQMAYYLPHSKESFSRINGVGAEKLARFSDDFLSLIHEYARENGLSERSIPTRAATRTRSPRREDSTSTYEATRELVLQKLPVSEIAARRGLSEGTVLGHIETLIEAGERLDIRHLLPPPERLAKIKAAFRQSGGSQLKPVRDLLGEDFSYAEIRIVRMHLRQDS